MRALGNLLAAIALLATAAAQAGPPQDIELSDGSVVRAEVISMDGGTYVLRSETLGRLEMPAANIRSISSGKPAAQANAVSPSTVQIDGIRKSIINDPEAMNKIQSLQDDPVVQNILNDSDTMRAISAGDLGTLMNDPKIKALMQHSTVQELTQGAR
ncbi:MAG: hypothetical protein ACU85U_10315 [Gammaproteobacteria bacterium]|jgi:hypothetical protein